MKTRSALLALALISPALVACSSSDNAAEPVDRIVVSAALFPIAEIAQRVGGELVEVVTLTPPGSDAHDVELTAKQVQRLEQSDAVLYFGDNFQPGTQKAIESLDNVTAVDLLTSVELLDASVVEDSHNHGHDHGAEKAADDAHDHGEHDPHVWLDPANMIKMTNRVASTLSKASPEHADTFSANAETYIGELTQLGEYLDATIGRPAPGAESICATKNLYTAHQGFTYLAHRAGLTLVPIAGVNPDEQVSAQYLEELSRDLTGKNITIFYESLIPSSAAEVLAEELDVATDSLNPLEGLSQSDIDSGITYVSAQRDNIDRIAKALGCA